MIDILYVFVKKMIKVINTNNSFFSSYSIFIEYAIMQNIYKE